MRYLRTLPPTRRPGFTLIEILVVVAIIAILVALTGAGIFYWIGGQQRRNSEGTIRTVNGIFQKQWSYVVEQAKKETPSAAIKALAGSDPTGERARVLWTKTRLMEAFPITYAEVNNPADPVFKFLNTHIAPNPRKNWDTYQRITGGKKTAVNPATESAACLLMALSVSRGGSVINADQLGPFIADTDVDGVKEIVDGWNMPLSFYRFAWGAGAPNIQVLNPAPAGSKNFKLADLMDPAGSLLSWPSGAGRTQFESIFHQIANAQGANYVIPVIVSDGLDQKLGLTLPNQCATSGLNAVGVGSSDNLYSFNLKGAS